MILQLLLSFAVLTPLQSADPLAQYRAAAIERWEADIQALERLDQQQEDPEHAVLFIGSSSIRRWDGIVQDLAPYSVIQRGYGGAKFSDLAVFADRLLGTHKFDAVAIFVGNDIAGKSDDKSPEEVLRLVKIVVASIHKKNPDAFVFLIAVTPTSSRFAVWDRIKQVNALMASYSQNDKLVHYVDTAEHFLDSSGKPNDKYFLDDNLHLNPQGYQVWAAVIKTALDKVLPPSQPASDSNTSP